MKILHVVHQYYPDHVGGTEFYTQATAHRLARRGYAVEIFCRRYAPGNGLERRIDSGEVRVWLARSGEFSPTGRFLSTFTESSICGFFAQVVQQTQPDLVHIQHLMGLPTALLRTLPPTVPVLITLHDYWWICANAQLLTNDSQQLCDGPRAYFNCAHCALARAGHPNLSLALPLLAAVGAWRNRLLQQVFDRAYTLIAPTSFVKDWYVAHGVSANKVQVIPHGIEVPADIQKNSRQNHSPLRIAYIGGLSWQKGVHIVVKAFQELGPEAELWIAGDETTDPAYVDQLRTLACPGVRFLGKLSRSAVWETLTQVDLVVVPSLWYETFSYIISEAFAVGVPVVASKLGPLRDRVGDGENGLLVPPGDSPAWQAALRRFLDEPALLARLKSGIPPVQTLDQQVDQLEKIYDQAKGGKLE